MQSMTKRRSWLNVTAAHQWQAAVDSGADCLILDLAGIDPQHLTTVLESGQRIYARVIRNTLDDDAKTTIATAVQSHIHGIVFDGAHNGADVQQLDIMLSVEEALAGHPVGVTDIVAIMDNATSVLNAQSFAEKSGRLSAIGWDEAQLSSAITTSRSENAELTDVARIVRSTTVLTAAASSISAIDTPSAERDPETLRKLCEDAKKQGFSGKIAHFPEQVFIINAVFGQLP
jgi:citrate lyase subunit beta/citryl-CoA lyase